MHLLLALALILKAKWKMCQRLTFTTRVTSRKEKWKTPLHLALSAYDIFILLKTKWKIKMHMRVTFSSTLVIALKTKWKMYLRLAFSTFILVPKAKNKSMQFCLDCRPAARFTQNADFQIPIRNYSRPGIRNWGLVGWGRWGG